MMGGELPIRVGQKLGCCDSAFPVASETLLMMGGNGQKGCSNRVFRKPSSGGFSLRNRRSSLKMI